MRFWDTSAIAPLIVEEEASTCRDAQLRADSGMLVWYATLAELESAVCRRVREGSLAAAEAAVARVKLNSLSSSWIEVQPTLAVRSRTLRLLRLHVLRAGDAFQLAAALTAFEENTADNYFLTSDFRLSHAAAQEGFRVE